MVSQPGSPSCGRDHLTKCSRLLFGHMGAPVWECPTQFFCYSHLWCQVIECWNPNSLKPQNSLRLLSLLPSFLPPMVLICHLWTLCWLGVAPFHFPRSQCSDLIWPDSVLVERKTLVRIGALLWLPDYPTTRLGYSPTSFAVSLSFDQEPCQYET